MLQFTSGAVIAAMFVATFLALLGAPVAVLLRTDDHNTSVLITITVIGMGWHLFVPWVPSSRRQIRRDVASRLRTGPFVYGVVLGTAIFTIVTTPFVWLGMMACFVSGSVAVASAYGAGFGLARSARLGAQWSAVRVHTPREFLDRVVGVHRLLTPRVIAVVGAVAIVSMGAR